MRADEIVDRPTGDATVEPSDDVAILDEDERRRLRDSQPVCELGTLVRVHVDDAQAFLLRHTNPGYEALHPS